uniref:Uncharacterized protein n=1 Tax=Paramoeba aestuarina TaxID=180227 RepID=A0A7S4UBC6_9EUKA
MLQENSDLKIENEALKKAKAQARSLKKKVGDQMITDKRQLEINFRRIEKDYDACREELKKQNKLRLAAEKKIYLLDTERVKLITAIQKGGYTVEEGDSGGLKPGYSEPPKEMRIPQPSTADLSQDNPHLPKKKSAPSLIQSQQSNVMSDLDGLEQEFEKTIDFQKQPSTIPKAHSDPRSQHQSSQSFQSFPQNSFPASSPSSSPSPFPKMGHFEQTLSAFKKRYLGQDKEFWVEDFPDTSISSLKLYMGQKVKQICELLQMCTTPAWKVEYAQRSKEMAFGLAGIYDAVGIILSKCPNLAADISLYNHVLEATLSSTDPAIRCLEHAFRGNDISASQLKAYLIEVLKTLREIN